MEEELIRIIELSKLDIHIIKMFCEGCPPTYMLITYSKEGKYIDESVEFAGRLIKYPIDSEFQPANPDNKVCSVAFSTSEQKWYGWSHRAIYGFGIGATCRKGDCHYNPDNFEEFRYRENMGACHCLIEDYQIDEGTNKLLCLDNGRLECSEDTCPNYTQGSGEWTAQTLEDCKLMAITFAKSVS